MGCLGKGCLFGALAGVILLLLLVLGSFFFSRALVSPNPTPLPVKPLPQPEMRELDDRIEQFEATPAAPSTTPAASVPPGETPSPAFPESSPARQLTLSAAEINGLIAANKKSQGRAFVTLSGNTARVQLSIPSDKVPGLPRGYLNGSFVITTDGPTPISALQVSRIEANGYPIPSGILSTNISGKSPLGWALEAAGRYNVTTAEIRNGVVILH